MKTTTFRFSSGLKLWTSTAALALACVQVTACTANIGPAETIPGAAGAAGSANVNGNSGAAGAAAPMIGTGGSTVVGPDTCNGDKVCHSLTGLGVDIKKTPRLDKDGKPLPDSFNPLGGKAHALFPIDELYVGGMKITGAQGKSSLFDDIPQGSPKGTAPQVISNLTDSWTQATFHTAVAADLDGDHRQEIVGIWQNKTTPPSNLFLHARLNWDRADSEGDIDLGPLDTLSMSAVAGDFDGDGKDDIAIVAALPTEIDILFVEAKDQTYKVQPSLTKRIPRQNPATASGTGGSQLDFRLAAGNLDYDAADELIVVTNEVKSWTAGQATANYAIYDDQSTGFASLKEGPVMGQDGATYVAIAAGVDIADIDGDRIGEPVFAGIISYDQNATPEYILAPLDDAKNQFKPLPGKHFYDPNGLREQTVSDFRAVFVRGLDVDGMQGDLRPEVLVNRFIYAYDPAHGTWTEKYSINQKDFQLEDNFHFYTDNAAIAVGDMNGDTRDDVALLSPDKAWITIWGATGDVPAFGQIARLPVESLGLNSHTSPMLVTANTDKDSSVLEFVTAESQLVFSEPVIIAALAAPPCLADGGQNSGACQTSLTKSKTFEQTKETAVTLSASLSIGTDFEDRTFSQSSVEFEATSTITATHSEAKTYSVEKSVEYTAGSMEDAVVFTTIPYDRYIYRVVSNADPKKIGKTVQINMPRVPMTLMVERSFYNSHIEDGSPKVDESVFTHAIGQPKSYPTSGAQQQLMHQYGGLSTDVMPVGQSSTGQVGVGLAIADHIGHTDQVEVGFEMSLKLTAGGVMGGFKVGASTSQGLTVSVGKATTYNGTVGTIDAEHFAKNQYSFGLFTYPCKTQGGQQFDVVNYWVE